MEELIKAQNDAYIEAKSNLEAADQIINDVKEMRRYQRNFRHSVTLKSLELKVDENLAKYANQRKQIDLGNQSDNSLYRSDGFTGHGEHSLSDADCSL